MNRRRVPNVKTQQAPRGQVLASSFEKPPNIVRLGVVAQNVKQGKNSIKFLTDSHRAGVTFDVVHAAVLPSFVEHGLAWFNCHDPMSPISESNCVPAGARPQFKH
jgi:hypothetical protein